MMTTARLEKVPQRLGSSWRYLKESNCNGEADWHYHHEFELVLHRHYSGKGYLGHYQGQVEHNTLWLIAPNTPHAFEVEHVCEGEQAQRHSIWFKKDWIANMMFSCIELRKLEDLLKKAEKGLAFNVDTGEELFELIQHMFGGQFQHQSSILHLADLLKAFSILVMDKSSHTLQSYARQTGDANNRVEVERIDRLTQYIESNYHLPLTLAELAQEMCISESSIHRLFESHFSESFSQYLKKLRLNHASDLLTNTSLPINIVAEKVGYRNQANFNRLFKDYKRQTPSQYRKKFSRFN
ncbi:AraC family transcriptional regulator [Vibrio makurazakiensis]|uniref:helix-turn-helix domain-containing protein n=1 Tax=Vibrio makurazakiensis TaxID=2910250 RepID=UPI003D0B85DA